MGGAEVRAAHIRDAPSGRARSLTDMTDQTSEKLEAVQNVVDRVGAYQDGAPEGMVEKELRAGLAEAGVGLEDVQVTMLATAIEKGDGTVDVASVLG